MLKCSRFPCCFGVTGKAFSGELRSSMRRIIGLVIFIQVTTDAGVRGVVVVILMTRCTVVGNQRMGSVQGINFIVCRETGRAPARRRGMAGFAGVGQGDGTMVWIG